MLEGGRKAKKIAQERENQEKEREGKDGEWDIGLEVEREGDDIRGREGEGMKE